MSDNTLKFLLAYQEIIYLALLIISALIGVKVQRYRARKRIERCISGFSGFPTPPKKKEP